MRAANASAAIWVNEFHSNSEISQSNADASAICYAPAICQTSVSAIRQQFALSNDIRMARSDHNSPGTCA